jgi:hypothetical protein
LTPQPHKIAMVEQIVADLARFVGRLAIERIAA